MTLIELAKLVKEMRDAQKRWFNPNTRTQEVLTESKRLERRVDEACREVLGGRPVMLPGLREGR